MLKVEAKFVSEVCSVTFATLLILLRYHCKRSLRLLATNRSLHEECLKPNLHQPFVTKLSTSKLSLKKPPVQ